MIQWRIQEGQLVAVPLDGAPLI